MWCPASDWHKCIVIPDRNPAPYSVRGRHPEAPPSHLPPQAGEGDTGLLRNDGGRGNAAQEEEEIHMNTKPFDAAIVGDGELAVDFITNMSTARRACTG